MTYYGIDTILKRDETYIEFQSGEKRIFDYFVMDAIDDKFLNYVKIVGIAQQNMKEKELDKCDYLDPLSGPPIFSERFVETFSALLTQDVEFRPAEIWCKSKSKQFFLAKIKRCIDWIDYENSGCMILSDGVKILNTPVVSKAVSEEFFLAKDSITKTRWVASEEFKKLVVKNKMNMKFYSFK